MIKMEGNNYNQRLTVHLPNDICRTLIGQGHSGMEPKVIIYNDLINEKENIDGYMKIVFAESMEERPIDRDYNAHGKSRITQPEILGDGYAYCVRIAYPGQVVIAFKDDKR